MPKFIAQKDEVCEAEDCGIELPKGSTIVINASGNILCSECADKLGIS